MYEYRFRRLPVVDEEGGLVSSVCERVFRADIVGISSFYDEVSGTCRLVIKGEVDKDRVVELLCISWLLRDRGL